MPNNLLVRQTATGAHTKVAPRHKAERRGAARAGRVLAALAGCALLALASGCASVRDYQGRVSAEQAFARGARATEAGDLARAESAFGQALRLQPDSPSLQARIGMAYAAMEPPRMSQALPYLQRALQLDPRQPAGLYGAAILGAARFGRDDWARQTLRQAESRFHRDALSLNNIGYPLVDADRLTAEAMPLLARAVKLAPDSGIIVDSLGWGYYRLGDLARAVKLLKRATELVPDDAEIQYHLGAAYADLGRTAAARARFRRALELNPEFAPARAALRTLGQQ